MPRFTIMVAVVLSLGGRAVGDERPTSHRDQRAQTQNGAPGTHRTRSFPIQLVKRPQEEDRRTAGAQRNSPIPIPPPGRSESTKGKQAPARTARSNVLSVALSSLAIVLGLFFLVVWLSRRALPRSAASLPSDVLEILGRSPLANRHHLQLIRVGKRLLLVSVSPDNAQTLAEITDPDEVTHLSGLCRQSQPGSISTTFRSVLHQLGTQSSKGHRRFEAGGEESDLANEAQLGQG